MANGKLLESGNGFGHVTIKKCWALLMSLAVAMSALCAHVAWDCRGNKDAAIVANFAIYGGLVIWAVMIWVSIYYTRRIHKTSIDVYENGVTGVGLSTFHSEFAHVTDFQLKYKDIASVGMIGKSVVINTTSAKYIIYAMNAKEIRDAILARKDALEEN